MPTAPHKPGAWPAVLLGGLVAAHFFVYLRKAAEIGWTEPADWGHILAVPLVAAWWLHSLRPRLRQTPAQPDWRGLPLLLAGLLGYDAALFPVRNGMLEGACLVLALLGLLWWTQGTARLRPLLAPTVFLLFTVRVSDRLWELATAKLQDIAASGAAAVLKTCTLAADFDVQIEGNVIRLFRHGFVHPLNVAEACSGIRSLMAFLALGFVLAFLPQGKLWWQRIALFALAAPVAVAVNIGRVTVLGLLTLVDPKLAQGDFHLLVGFLMLVPAAGLLLGCGWVLEKLVVREEEEHPESDGGNASPATPRPEDPFCRPHLAVGGFFGILSAGTCVAFLWFGLRFHAALLLLPPMILLCGLAWRRKSILPVGIVLGVAGGLLCAAIAGQHLYLRAAHAILVKQPLPLRQDLHALPKAFGAWTMAKEEPPEPAEVEHALGTKDYLTRWYTGPGGRLARLHIAYYTGSVDTVPHVPDRCFVAAGATPLATRTVALAAGGTSIPATFFEYRGGGGEPSAVVYFFSANGRFLATPQDVRLNGFNIGDRFGYHCKIEMEFPGLHEQAQVLPAAAEFADAALPSLLNCLPDWEKANAR